jgi:hypothetical protein
MTKISSLSDIGTGVASNDTFVLVDASDPTTPNKKIQQQNLFLIPDGSAGTPGLRFLNDLDTGIYRPGANQLALSTNGTGKLFIDSAGKVTVKGAGTAAFVVEGSAPNNSLVIKDTTGNVGIGTSSPSNTLHVAGTGRFNVSGANNAVIASDGGDPFIYTEQAAGLKFGTNSVVRMTINSSGSVGIGTTSPQELLDLYSAGNTTLRISGSSGGGSDVSQIDFFRIGSNVSASLKALRGGGNSEGQLAFYTATSGTPTEKARIDSSGRLGIATSSPDTLLRVGDTIGCVTSDVFSIFKNGSSTGYDFLSVSIGTSNTSHGVAYIDISHGGQVSGVGTQYSLTRWKIIKAAGSAAVVTNLDATESFASMITASVADNVVTFRAATASNSTNAFNGRFAIFCTGTALTTATSVAVAFARL